MVGRSDVYKQVLVVEGLVLAVVVHEGGVFQQPQSGGGDGAAQPGRAGRRLRDHPWGRLAVWQAEGTVVGERFDAGERNIVRNLVPCLLACQLYLLLTGQVVGRGLVVEVVRLPELVRIGHGGVRVGRGQASGED